MRGTPPPLAGGGWGRGPCRHDLHPPSRHPSRHPHAASADARLRDVRKARSTASRSPKPNCTTRCSARTRRWTPSLAEVDGTTVGFALWYFTFGTFSGRYGLFVEDIFVEQAHRGRGIGLALFRHMARIARASATASTWRGTCSTGTRRRSSSTAASAPSRCEAGSRSSSAATRWSRWPKEHDNG